MVEPPEIIMEIREEITLSPKGGKPISKKSHFIKPMLSYNDLTPNLPAISIPFQPVLPKCTFNGWRDPSNEWLSWVDKMCSVYKLTWKRAGIYDAILSSRFRVNRNEELVLGLGESWCCETNTFVFCWGETTLTLEDLMILGFSVLGNSVSGYNNDRQVAEVEKQLLNAYNKLRRELSSSTEVDQGAWMRKFMGKRSEIEHEAFLTLWLSRFVLPSYPFNSIVLKTFKIAVCLAKGIEIALAPAVLSSIFKDLSLLKSVMGNVDKDYDFGNDVVMVTLWAPLQWVQVWAWERFPGFRPKPNEVEFGQPRIARWHDVEEKDIGNVRPMLQSAGDSFEWRPYCKGVKNLPLPAWVTENEQLVYMDENVRKEVRILAHCLKVSELAGLESVEQYNPHRVAMQFGYDQDVPHTVKRCLLSYGMSHKQVEQLAWLTYADPIKGKILIIPPRLYEPQVTLRYLNWLREGRLTRPASFKRILTRKREPARLRRLQPPCLLFDIDEIDSPPRIEPREAIAHEIDIQPDFRLNSHEIDVQPDCGLNSSGKDLDVPPGFPPDYNVSKKTGAPLGSGSKRNADHAIDVLPNFVLRRVRTKSDVQPGSVAQSILPGAVSKSTSANRDVPPGFVPRSSGTNLDAPTSFVLRRVSAQPDVQPDSVEKSISSNRDVLPGFASNSISSKRDVPPGFVPKSTSCNLDVPPGFVMKITSTKVDISPGFTPNSVAAKKIKNLSHDIKKEIVGDLFDVPPGVVPKSTLNDLDVPPGFTPKCIEPAKSDISRKHSSDSEPLVKVKKERIESIRDVESLVRPGHQNAHSLPGNLGLNEENSPNTVPGLSHARARLDINARIEQIRKKVTALREGK